MAIGLLRVVFLRISAVKTQLTSIKQMIVTDEKSVPLGRGVMMPVRPRMMPRLKIFDPMILPSATSLRFCITLATTATISGNEVPMAIIDSPMTASLNPA